MEKTNLPKKKFIDTSDWPDTPQKTDKVKGKNVLQNLQSLAIGSGTRAFYADKSGIWLGAKTFLVAPFSVDMAGNVVLASATITGGTIGGTTVSGYLPLAGGTMTGDLILNADPSVALGAATKQYVDGVVTSITATVLAAAVCNNNEVVCNGGEIVYN